MRLKNNPKAKGIVLNHPLVINDPSLNKGKWSQSFLNNNPLYLEIGCGKGQFITNLSKLHPDNNYIGIEQYESVLYLALEKAEEISPSNLKFLCVHAEYLTDYFENEEVNGIYLNFSDPWPKKRHAKRRLTSPRFLDIYKRILKSHAIIELKTDNDDLYAFSLETISDSPDFLLLQFTDDLYNNPSMINGNISTEYEDKFTERGKNINKIIFAKK